MLIFSILNVPLKELPPNSSLKFTFSFEQQQRQCILIWCLNSLLFFFSQWLIFGKICLNKNVSDNVSKFTGAARNLKELILMGRHENMKHYSSIKVIEGSFIPLHTAHFLGVWSNSLKCYTNVNERV